MNLLQPAIHNAIFLAASALPGALFAQSNALLGHWAFQTATGTTTQNGAEVDLINKGTLHITDDSGVPTATISWLDEQGQITSSRQAKGVAGPATTIFRHTSQRVTTGRGGKKTSVDVNIRWTLSADSDRLIGESWSKPTRTSLKRSLAAG